jgi:hypothetical protein
LRYLDMAAHDRFGQYARDLLASALARSGLGAGDVLRALPRQDLSQGRLMAEMKAGRLDVVWSMTSQERERDLLPVRVPLDRGLLGWRLLLVRQTDEPSWRQALTLTSLAQHVGGQGAHWPDVDILRANGLRIETATRANNLLTMLQQRRIDYYPRSALEVLDELQLPEAAGLDIATGGWLRYPAASYFFLRPGLQGLATALEATLSTMADDGTLQALFEQRMGAVLQRLPLSAARSLALRNPLLPSGTPLRRANYWLQPGR